MKTQRLFRGRCVLVTVFIAVCAILAGPADAKDSLILGLDDTSTTFDPATTTEIITISLFYDLYERLVTYEEGDYTQAKPQLAKSWKISEDGKTWTFYLYKDRMFASGNPINADAVVFSLRRVPELAGGLSSILTQLGIHKDSISQVDEHTVQIVLDQQYAPGLVLSCLASYIGSILDPEVVMSHASDGDLGSAWLYDHSAGSGRFMLEKRAPGVETVLTANPKYAGKPPAFTKIILKHIPAPETQMTLLENGEIDIAWNLQPSQIELLSANPDIQILESYIFHIKFLGMNVAYEPLQKSEVRDAIRYAVDYDGIIDYVLEGAAMKIQTIIPQGVFGYNPEMPYRRDLEKAKQLLAEGGYPNGFEIDLLCFETPPWVNVSQKIQQDLADIGIQVNLVALPSEGVHEKMFNRDFQLLHMMWSLDYVDPSAIVTPFVHTDSLDEDATFQLMSWWLNYMNPETTALTEQASRELDQEKRAVLYQQITDIILDDGPYAPLYSLLTQYAVRSEVNEFLETPPPYTGFPVVR